MLYFNSWSKKKRNGTLNVDLTIKETDDFINEDDEEEINSADNDLFTSKGGIYILKA